MEHRSKFNVNFVIKVVVIAAISLKLLSFLYESSFGRYFDKQEVNEAQQAFTDKVKSTYPFISEVKFEHGNIDLTVDETYELDVQQFKKSLIGDVCKGFSLEDAAININARYSINTSKRGNLVASWLVFRENCT